MFRQCFAARRDERYTSVREDMKAECEWQVQGRSYCFLGLECGAYDPDRKGPSRAVSYESRWSGAYEKYAPLAGLIWPANEHS